MRRKGWWIFFAVLVAGLGTLLALRWQVWFVEPEAPEWKGTKKNLSFHCFGNETVPGFTQDSLGSWQDTIGSDTLCILVLGDVHNQLTHEQYQRIMTDNPLIDCYAQLGDWVERGQTYYIQQLYAELDSTDLMRLPLLNCPGNHEYHKGIKRTINEGWTKDYHHPNNGPIGFEGTTYYVDFTSVRWISINTAGLYWLHDYTRVSRWAHEAVRNAGNRKVIVAMHHPIYSSSKGRFYGWNWLMFWYPLKEADMVFTGHDHNYTRWQNYVCLTSTRKNKIHKNTHNADCTYSGEPLYSLVYISHGELWGETRLVDTGEKIDYWKSVENLN